MGEFITSHSRIEQTDVEGYWKLVDNELYLDDDGTLLLTPRYLWTDGYTFPGLIMAILGDKNKYDARPCHAHDLFCRFHQRLVIDYSLTQLKLNHYLRTKNDKIVLDDIPIKHLKIETMTKKEADDTFKRMMNACNMSFTTVGLIRFGVTFNLNWYLKTGKKSLEEYDIFKSDIGLVNGV